MNDQKCPNILKHVPIMEDAVTKLPTKVIPKKTSAMRDW